MFCSSRGSRKITNLIVLADEEAWEDCLFEFTCRSSRHNFQRGQQPPPSTYKIHRRPRISLPKRLMVRG
ncbi:hypothetical protein PM082_003998 [Marasmius tenuissimus]|nr:hypothetical protein PM082_003998 [Marasmius tenuissimus]